MHKNPSQDYGVTKAKNECDISKNAIIKNLKYKKGGVFLTCAIICAKLV